MSDVVMREQRGGVLLLTLNRPEQMNSLNSQLVSDLGVAIAEAQRDDGIRVVVITGAGRAFCAGADLLEARTVVDDAARFRTWLMSWRSTFRAFEQINKPVVAAVNGLTLAGGLELALSCDFIVATRSAKIGDVHANYGLVPGGGGSQRLPDAVGSRWARWLMFTGEVLATDQARAIGLIQDVFNDDSFADDVWAMGAKMAARSAPALAFMKRMSTSPRVTDQGLDLEIEAAAHLIVGPDAQEGLAAFTGKREPHFKAL